MKPFCISFAGPAGCSKTPVAQHLSCNLQLPVLNNDVIRTEMREDEDRYDYDEQAFRTRARQRLQALATRKVSFIYDASHDRFWAKFQKEFPVSDYNFGIISFDLSREFYEKLLIAKKYDHTLTRAEVYMEQHAAFIKDYPEMIICTITDETFHDRLAISLEAVRKFIDDRTALIR